MDTPTIVTVSALSLPLVALWLTVLRDRRSRQQYQSERETKLEETRRERDNKVDIRFERIDVKVETIWGAFTAQLLTNLHHPDPAKIIPDGLLKKYEASITKPNAITADELIELVGYMIAVAENKEISLEERQAAAQILRLIRHHPLWSPNEKLAAQLEKVIGPDMHPKID